MTVKILTFEKLKNSQVKYIISFLLLSLSLPMLLLAQTRSALAPLLIFILWFVTKHFSYLANILTYMISFLIFLFLFITSDIFITVFDYLLRGQTSEQLLSFSSRFIVWEATLQNVEYNIFRLFFGLNPLECLRSSKN